MIVGAAGARAPYPGLRSFRREESDLFFGREDFVSTMVDRLAEPGRFLAVLGSSGTGKSSVVKTGLLESLELGLMAKAGSTWHIAEFRPGSDPLRNLAGALLAADPHALASDVDLLRGFLARGPRSVIEWCRDGNLPEGTNLLLLADQFEELFRYQDYAKREETHALVELLLESAHSTEFPIYVTLTMRSEYLGACALVEGLAEAISRGMVLIPRMTRAQCREAIVGPAEVCGIKTDLPLVNQLLNDLASFASWDDTGGDELDRQARRADQLPLLQYTLNRMWLKAREQRGSGKPGGGPLVLRLSDYEAIGGLRGALNAHADQLLNELAAKGLGGAVATVFRSLVSGTTVAEAVRRPRRFGELVTLAGGNEQGVRDVVDTFRAAGCNFLAPELDPQNLKPLASDTVVDISHEALIRQWSKLSEWLLQESRSAQNWRRLQDRMTDGEPLRGRELATLVAWKDEMKPNAEWARRYGGNYDAAMAFLESSRRAEQRQRQRTMALRAAAIALLIIAPSLYFWNQSRLERQYATEQAAMRGQLEEKNRELEQTKKDLEANNQALEQAKKALEANNEALEQAKKALEANNQELKEAQAKLAATISTLEAERKKFEATLRSLQDRIAKLEKRPEPPGEPGGGAPGTGIALGPAPTEAGNYGDESTSFNMFESFGKSDPKKKTVPFEPVTELEGPTPDWIPGGRPVGKFLKTVQLYQALKDGKLDGAAFIMVDAWGDPKHATIPTAKRLDQAGRPPFNKKTRDALWEALGKLTGGDFTKPIVFFSRDVKNWEGYNAALRAIDIGYLNVYWYRGGLAAWKAAGQPCEQGGRRVECTMP